MSKEKHPDDCGCGGCTGPVRPLKTDRMVEGLDPEMCGPEGLAVLRGYLGDGASDGMWRLYLSLELDEYFLLRERDIVAQQQSGLGSVVWMKRDALVRYVRLGTAGGFTRGGSIGGGSAASASYLAGTIGDQRRAYGPGPQDASWLTGPYPPPTSEPPDCPSSASTSRKPCC